jgi:FKBP-type peptidyl-prolyl cis-trans isomerase
MSLQIEDLVVGTGAEAVSGQNVSVHYTGWLTDGSGKQKLVDHYTDSLGELPKSA